MNEILYFFEERNLLCTMSMSICLWIAQIKKKCCACFTVVCFFYFGCKGARARVRRARYILHCIIWVARWRCTVFSHDTVMCVYRTVWWYFFSLVFSFCFLSFFELWVFLFSFLCFSFFIFLLLRSLLLLFALFVDCCLMFVVFVFCLCFRLAVTASRHRQYHSHFVSLVIGFQEYLRPVASSISISSSPLPPELCPVQDGSAPNDMTCDCANATCVAGDYY